MLLYCYNDNILHNVHQLIDEISETIIVSSSLLVCMMCKSITVHLRVFFKIIEINNCSDVLLNNVGVI